MIAVFSSSSPRVRAALFDPGGAWRESRESEAARQASETLLGFLASFGDQPWTGFVADLGPGSFVGTRVAVMLAKTLGKVYGVPVAGVSAFDLIGTGVTAIPNRRHEYLVRHGGSVEVVQELPAEAIGYGPAFLEPTFPDPARVAIGTLTWVAPEALLPEYVVPPAISTPKTPYRSAP